MAKSSEGGRDGGLTPGRAGEGMRRPLREGRQHRTRAEFDLRTMMRKPSCLISCSHISPEGSVSALVGRQGAMKPAGSERNMAANIDALRQNASRARRKRGDIAGDGSGGTGALSDAAAAASAMG